MHLPDNRVPLSVVMALRAQLKALKNSAKNNGKYYFLDMAICTSVVLEIYYLVLWETEGTVSVHPKNELKDPVPSTTVCGETCTVKFGRTYYTGKIACSGKFSHI